MKPKIKTVDCRSQNGGEIHRAGWIVADPQTIIPNGWLLVENGMIRETGQGRIPASLPICDHGPGAIIPALVNAHTHLELSALKNEISFSHGFRPWVRHLLEKRAAMSADKLIQGAKDGIAELKRSGCIGIGEISSLGLTQDILRESGLAGVWFREYLGEIPSMPENFSLSGSGDMKNSLAGHAPHTSSPELLKALKENCRSKGLPFSLHLAESEDEMEFLNTGKGLWADFLTERGIDFSAWGLPVRHPVHYADQLGLVDEKSLFVHLLHAGSEEFLLLKEKGSHVCLCPRSNKNLHGQLPDLPGLLRAGLRPCLGSDSLASAESLILFDEMALPPDVFRKYPRKIFLPCPP